MEAKTLKLPKRSHLVVIACLFLQAMAVHAVFAQHDALSTIWIILAILLGTYLADLITALFHFGFDYVWPDDFPVMGPISVEFRAHHDHPQLDPSAIVANLTQGAYMGITFAIGALCVAAGGVGFGSVFSAVVLLTVSIWGLFFHQIHSYSHMGHSLASDEFNAAVARISALPKDQQRREFATLFEELGIPRPIRCLQRCKIILQPEVHWRHHISFESHFSSLNGWSDPLTNIFFAPYARRRKRLRQDQGEGRQLVGYVQADGSRDG